MKRSPIKQRTPAEKAAKKAASKKILLPGECMPDKAAIARKRKNRTRKTSKAIKAVAGQRELKRSELMVLLSEELSRICRERDQFVCFVTGRVCPPGILPGQACAAHLLPRNSVPFWLRYDPRIVVWMEGVAHSTFDGRTARGSTTANQGFVWGKLAREKPDVFELLTSRDWKHEAGLPVPIHEVRAKLDELRAITFI